MGQTSLFLSDYSLLDADASSPIAIAYCLFSRQRMSTLIKNYSDSNVDQVGIQVKMTQRKEICFFLNL